MIFALFPNLQKEEAVRHAIDIRTFLEKKNIQVVSDEKEAKAIGAKPLSSVETSSISFLVSLGGDGSILRLMHRHPEIDAPIIGINLGSLGFLADIPVTEL